MFASLRTLFGILFVMWFVYHITHTPFVSASITNVSNDAVPVYLCSANGPVKRVFIVDSEPDEYHVVCTGTNSQMQYPVPSGTETPSSLTLNVP